MSGQQQGLLQPLTRQQSGIGDAQLLQQQMTLKRMQELHRQQQIQQLEAMQRNRMNKMSSFSNQAAGNHAPSFINGTSMHEASNYPFSSQIMAGSPNWLQHGASPAMQGNSNGVAMPLEEGQSLHLMGLNPQQASQSLYGVPVSNARSGGGFLMSQVDKTRQHQAPIQGNFSNNQHPFFAAQVNLHDGMTVSKQGFEGKGAFEYTFGQGSGNATNVENFNQRSVPELDGRPDFAVSSAPSLPDQTTKHVASSQAPVALDPTEEKILFGSHGNIWEAFGESLSGSTGGSNHLDGAFPSIQSGSWSALMQSAVAESSSNDIGLQGECTGVGEQNSGSLTRNQQPSGFPDSGEQQVSCVGVSDMALISSRPLPGASLSSGYNTLGLQKSLTNQPREVLPNMSGQQSSGGGQKWLGCSQAKAIAEENQGHESAYFTGDFSSKNITASWNHQQRTSSLANGLGGLNFMQSASDGGKISRDEKFQGNVSDRSVNVNIGDGGCTSILGVGPDSNVEMKRQHINSKDVGCISDNDHHREFWRSVNSDVKSGLGKFQQHLNMGMQGVMHSSMSSCDRGITEMPETGNNDKRESSSDSYCSNLSNRASNGGVRENVWLDAGDMHGVSGGKQNSSGLVGWNAPGPCRFEYQPSGDLNMSVECLHGTKDIIQSQPTGNHHPGVQKGHDQQSMFPCPSSDISPELEKSLLPNFQGDTRLTYGISPSCNYPRHVSSIPTSFDKSGGISTPDSSVTSSQNMLDLLHKVDQSKEQSAMANLCSSDCNRPSSETEASNRNAALGPKHSFSSQGFRLQLAPPSQGVPAPNFVMASKRMSHAANSSSSSHFASDKGDKSQPWLGPAASGQQALVPNTQRNFPASFPSGSLYLKSLLHNQQMTKSGVNVNCDQPGNVSFDRQASHDKHMTSATAQREKTSSPGTDHSDSLVSMQQIAALNVSSSLRPSSLSSMYQKDNLSSATLNLWTNMTMAQQTLAGQPLNAAEMIKNEFQMNNIRGTSASIEQKQDGQDTMGKGDAVDSQGFVDGEEQQMTGRQADASQKTEIMFHGGETFAANPSDASFPNSAATKNDVVDFGRSLKPYSNRVDSCTLLHQMQAMKEMDPTIWQAKRFKGPDDASDDHSMVGKSQHSSGLNYADKNAPASHASVSSADDQMPSFMSELGNDREKHIQQQHANASQDLLSYKGEPQKLSDNAAPRAEHSQISLQMAPTCLKQFGALKNGELVTLHDMQRPQVVAHTDQQLMINKSLKDLGAENTLGHANTVVDTSQMANVWQKPPHVPRELLSSGHQLGSSLIAPGIASTRLKKRKSATIDLLPWHKEVALGYQGLPNMSSAEEEWAEAAHRLFEKIEDETDVDDDVSPLLHSRRRLILTTQLMQHIFQPPPATILSLNAIKEYEAVAYFAARLALADACSLTSESESDSCVSPDEEKLSSEKPKADGRISDAHLNKVVEQFINRARILDNDLLRLDKRVSVLDLRLECQDLERFSVINRFVRFHGRGQVDGTKTSSSDATTTAPPTRPQRYVKAYPMPKNLPERIQCLSL